MLTKKKKNSFDWEVWITTTARMERTQGRLPVPPFLVKAIDKLLVGDEVCFYLYCCCCCLFC